MKGELGLRAWRRLYNVPLEISEVPWLPGVRTTWPFRALRPHTAPHTPLPLGQHTQLLRRSRLGPAESSMHEDRHHRQPLHEFSASCVEPSRRERPPRRTGDHSVACPSRMRPSEMDNRCRRFWVGPDQDSVPQTKATIGLRLNSRSTRGYL